MRDHDHERMDEDERMTLLGDVLVLYLSLGSALGDCDLYRRMGRALAEEDSGQMHNVMAEFRALPPALRERILAGDPAFDEGGEAADALGAGEADDALDITRKRHSA